jgi:Protein of unknown function (DUF2726)
MIWLALVTVLLAALGLWLWWRNRPNKLPDVWPLTLRKVFTLQEQQAFNLLRSAFPEHAILVKLQVSRFVQLTDKRNMKYWFGLLTPLYVTFAVSRTDGKMLAAIDIDSPQNPGSRSGYTLKRRAFDACKLMYLRYDFGSLPTMRALRTSVLGEKAADLVFNAPTPAAPTAPAADKPVPMVITAAPLVVDPKVQEEQQRLEAAAKAEHQRAVAVTELNELIKDRQRQLKSTADDQNWSPDSIIERDSFLRPDSRIDNVDVPLH